jgi:7-cyano-7-deazaguanine synthase|tara:strand:+ start:1519 stop:2358 length:840 start_codon:yes stop_codon:yes gene_type:complete
MNKKQAVLSLSGGMDSSTVLLRLLADGYEVTALSFDYGQKHKVELERAQALVHYLNNSRIGTLPTGDLTSLFPKITYGSIKLDGLAPMLNSALVEGGKNVPEGHYEDDNMKETVVPNRNKIFSSIIQAVALSKANEKDTEVHIAMGIHAGDHAIYPDCRQEFRDADYKAFTEGNWDADRVSYVTPYLDGDKFDILLDGVKCCEQLGLQFDKVYRNTNTSYKPINIDGKWYSDYKSASSVERVEAFIKLGRPDPCEYADESGPVTWDVVTTNVSKVLAKV